MTKKNVILVISFVLLVAIAIIVYLSTINKNNSNKITKLQKNKTSNQEINPEKLKEISNNLQKNQTKKAANESQKLIEEALRKKQEKKALEKTKEENNNQNNNKNIDTSKYKDINTFSAEITNEDKDIPKEEDTVEIIKGINKVNINTGDVVTDDNKTVDISANIEDPDAPKTSAPMSENEIPENGVNIKMYNDKLVPSEFTAQAGQVVALSATSMNKTKVLKFKSKELSGIAIGLIEGETRSVVFNAPKEPGEYIYYEEMASFSGKKLEGKMIVK